MTKVILTVTDEQLERLDSIGLFNPEMAGVLWQQITITPVDKAESKGIDPNDMTHMFDGVTEMPKDAFKGWSTEELLKQIRQRKVGNK